MASKAAHRVYLGFRPATISAYNSKFRLFLAFWCFINIQLSHLSPLILLSYLEFLVENNVSHSSIANHMSAIKASCAIYDLNTHIFQDSRLKYYFKALALHKPFKVTLKKIVDIPTLILIANTCDSMYMGHIFKAFYLLAFFSFLRISNLVPHSKNSFSPLQQLAQGDIIFAPPGLHILVKWSKTLQTKDKIKIIKVPALGASPLCPVVVLKVLLKLTPNHPNLPLFQIKQLQTWSPLTDTKVRRHFKAILAKLQLHNSAITIHTLRRSGATFAYNVNVPLQEIQSHGTWTSECVWNYITQDHQASQQVAQAFQKHLFIPPTS